MLKKTSLRYHLFSTHLQFTRLSSILLHSAFKYSTLVCSTFFFSALVYSDLPLPLLYSAQTSSAPLRFATAFANPDPALHRSITQTTTMNAIIAEKWDSHPPENYCIRAGGYWWTTVPGRLTPSWRPWGGDPPTYHTPRQLRNGFSEGRK